jgi:predicted PurR-regulated permease PerM
LEITVSWTTLLKIFLACLLAYLAIRLWRLTELLLLALMVAIAFQPLIQWTKSHRWPKWIGVFLSAFVLLGSTTLFVIILVPTIGTQGTEFVKQLPSLLD